MKHLFIFNPRSLKGKKRLKLISQIKEKCKDLPYEIYFSTSAEDAKGKAKSACEAGEEICVYAGGGDGSVHQIAEAIYGYQNAVLSVIPVGTGNDFVRNFGGKKRFLGLEHITDGEEITIDLIKANDYICANMINIGFDASVVTRVEQLRSLPFMGHSIAYTVGLVIQLLRFPKEQMRMSVNGESFDRRFLLTYIANGQYCGGGYRSASKAKLDDGLLDVMSVNPLSRLQFVGLVGSYKKGTLLDNKKLKHLYQFYKIETITFEKDTPFEACLDGEMCPFTKLSISVMKNAMCLRIPKGEKR